MKSNPRFRGWFSSLSFLRRVCVGMCSSSSRSLHIQSNPKCRLLIYPIKIFSVIGFSFFFLVEGKSVSIGYEGIFLTNLFLLIFLGFSEIYQKFLVYPWSVFLWLFWLYSLLISTFSQELFTGPLFTHSLHCSFFAMNWNRRRASFFSRDHCTLNLNGFLEL